MTDWENAAKEDTRRYAYRCVSCDRRIISTHPLDRHERPTCVPCAREQASKYTPKGSRRV